MSEVDKKSSTPEVASPGSEILTFMRRNKLFDARWYARRYSIAEERAEDLERDFLEEGAKLGRDPNPLFDAGYYKARYAGDYDSETEPAFFHYARVGSAQSFSPHPIIDPTWVKNYLDSIGADEQVLSAVLHKCVALGLNPNPCFSVEFYLRRYPEIGAKRSHPVLHYVNYGSREKRSPHPLFWAEWVNRNAEKKRPVIGLLDYLHDRSLWNSITPNPFFSGQKYLEEYPDVAAASMNPLLHYLWYGQNEKRRPNAALDPDWIAEQFGAAIKATKLDPLSFLLRHGSRSVTPNSSGKPLVSASPAESVNYSQFYELTFGEPVRPLNSRKRILFVSHNLRVQGAQTSLFELAIGLRRNAQCDIIVFAPDDGPMKHLYQGEGIAVTKFVLPVAGMDDDKRYERLKGEIRSQIREIGPDIVHGNTVQSYHLIALSRELGIPCVWNIRESEPPLSHAAALRPNGANLFQQALQSSPVFAFVSDATQQLWTESFPTIDSVRIHNGIDYSRLIGSRLLGSRARSRAMFGAQDHELVLLNVGTWTERKGQLDIVRCLPAIDRRFWPLLKVILIGANESDYGKQIKNELQSLPSALREKVRVRQETGQLSGRAGVLAAYRASDIFLFPSRIESYPRVVNEALFFGLPIVSTPCFGAREQIREGVNGFFYEEGNVAQLASLATRIMGDADLRKRLSAGATHTARHEVTQYEEMVDSYHSLYSRMLQK